jgi:hypothetical protein
LSSLTIWVSKDIIGSYFSSTNPSIAILGFILVSKLSVYFHSHHFKIKEIILVLFPFQHDNIPYVNCTYPFFNIPTHWLLRVFYHKFND